LFEFKAVLFVAAMAFLLGFSKFYVWLSILPGLVFLFWSNHSAPKKAVLKFAIVIITLGIIGFNIEKIITIQSPLVTLSQKQLEFNKLANGEMTDAEGNVIPIANSAIQLNKLEPTFSSFLSNAPLALTNVLFRPYVWEMKSIMMLMAGLENILIVLIIVLCIIFIKPLKEIGWTPVLFCLSFVIIQFIVIGETTPIIGAIARYKTPALPFLLIAFLLMLDSQKIGKNLPFLKRTLN
jgi:hypothetical protein